MNYSKFQKFTSSFLIFALLFSITFRVPYFDFKTFAGNDQFYNLVSIIVDQKSYDAVKSEIDRYSRDIQGVLENTKVVILPTPSNTPAFNIASLNESLYTEGLKAIDKSADFQSKLIGTVVIGDFELPNIYDNNTYSRTILPFTDFEDKVYIYNHDTDRYEKNTDNRDGLKSEIWHGVISPNLGTFADNVQGLKDYFDKNHDYYAGTGNFKYSGGVLNGNNTVGVPSVYEPFVFYYDQFREEKALNYNSFQAYEAYLENKEDINYSRFNKELADKVTNKSMGVADDTIGKLLDKVDSDMAKKYIGERPDTSRVPDIQTRYIVENVTKKFIEIFAKGTIGEFRKDVNNAGRYNKTGGDINVDMIPYIVTVLDLVNDEITKDVNTEVEKQIDDIVKNGFSRKIALPTRVIDGNGCGTTYQNYLYGTKAEDISSATQCSIYRGSNLNGGTLVEANRGTNINLSKPDNDILYNEPDRNYCYQNLLSGAALNGFWGRNSPLNLDTQKMVEGQDVLKAHDYKGAIYPIFDIGGGKKIDDSRKIQTPLNCLENNYILAQSHDVDSDGKCYVDYRIPTFGSRVNWSCTTDNNDGKTYGYAKSFDANYKSPNGDIYLDGNIVLDTNDNNLTFSYKTIPSYIEHKSPTADELTTQVNAMATKSLPVDKDRYIDFISAKGEYAKIEYPNLFRLDQADKSNISFETITKELEKILADKSKEINDLIVKNDPSSLQAKDKELYDLLKTGAYPKADIDLTKILKDKKDSTLKITGDSKTLSYYDTLVFSQYWNNLNSVSAKYGFIFDNYLVDQFGEQESNYLLSKNKKQYEISYLGAPGDAQNMYVKMDPKAKAENPYADIFSKNIELSSNLFSSNIGTGSSGVGSSGASQDSNTKCGPPDGVPIWNWIPAIMCWLGDMMPPTISISEGVCGSTLLTDEGGVFQDANFLSDSEKQEVLQCNGDVDKNGVNDCIEKNLTGGYLELSADSDKYYYNSNALLKATILDKDGNVVKIANSTDVNFELIKIESAKDTSKEMTAANTQVVFDVNSANKNDFSLTKPYITFNNQKVRSSYGVANYGVGVKSANANIYLSANVLINDASGNKTIFLKSDPLQIQVRGNRLFNSSYKLSNSSNGLSTNYGISSMKVSDKTNLFLVDGTTNTIDSVSNLINNSGLSEEKLVLLLQNLDTKGTKTDINYPLNVSVKKSGKQILEDIQVSKDDMKNFKSLLALKTAGSYSLEITDANGFKTVKNIELLPDVPNSVDMKLGTSVLETGGNITTNFVTIYDKYQNPVSGNFYDLEFKINGNSVSFLDTGSNKLTTSTYEGYKIFRLKSNNTSGKSIVNVTVLDDEGNKLANTNKTVDVYSDINLTVKPISGDIKVGGATYKFEISLRNKNGAILTDFDSRAYLTADSIFLESTNPYFELKNGVAEVEFKTKTVAGKNIPIEFQVEGLKNIVQKNVTIYPDKAMKLDLNLSQNKIEASSTAFANLKVELKDRYNNLVFNDNSTALDLEILEQYSTIIKSDKNSDIVKEGTSSFKIYGTVNPGVAYFKVGTSPSLSLNSFTINNGEKDIVINGVGENALKIETFYFWNQSKLSGKKYNGLYTTLLGSNYGDIYEKNYLAGSLLFNRNNRSLAVTSQLNNPYSYNNILDLNNNGGLKTLYTSRDLTQDIVILPTFINNKLGLNIYNQALNTFIGKIFYNFDDSNKLSACETNLSSCIDAKQTSIAMKSVSDKYNVYFADSKLIFRDIYGKNLFEISENGTINRFGSVEFEFNKKNTSKYLSINIKTGGKIIGELGYNFINPVISTSTEDHVFDSKIDNTKNSILVLLKTSAYGTYNNGNTNNQSKIFYYNDPFASDNKLNSFSSDNMYGIENFSNEQGIGWSAGNKSLLEFAAGKSVGDSVKDYMSFSVINLGDPVLSLKQIKAKLPKTDTDRSFDSSIGKLLSTDTDITSYETFDYNNDSKTDVLLIKNDNHLKLLENKSVDGNFVDLGNLAFLADLGASDLIKTGDFTGDNYDDIFFVSDDGKPYLLNNVNKNFERISLSSDFGLSGKIVRAEKYDMDNDGIDDIVTLDDFGEVNIFYGGSIAEKPKFTKLKVTNEQGITLDSGVRNDGGLVYFDGLYQPSQVQNQNSKMDSYLFVRYPYGDYNTDLNPSDYINGDTVFPDDRGNLYFQKSEYSEYSGLKVEKRYIDTNGKFVSSNDIVQVEVTLTNTSNKRLNNVVYAEQVPQVFELNKNSFESQTDFDIYDGESGYNYMIDNFDIPLNGSIKYTYETKVRPLKYGNLQVGLFENGEIGDDKYGDIILKPDNKNCSDAIEIYRSTNPKTYEKGTKAPTCDEEKIKLPSHIEQNTFDSDGNGVPDYIDKLTKPENIDQAKQYSKEKLAEIYKDNDSDGLPNEEDNFDMDGSITLDLGGMTSKVDDALQQVDNIVKGLNCGFGNESCFASPLNWAPLAPGGDPVFMGETIGDGLIVDEGLPIFSMNTWMQVGPVCVPTVWPTSVNSTGCSGKGAGGMLGIDNPTNYFRLFITPTLTGGMGTAICFGGPASVAGVTIPESVAPLVPGGNCIVVAKKTFGCAGDGSDGDPASTGIPMYSADGSYGIINGNCDKLEFNLNPPNKEKIGVYLKEAQKGPVEQAFDFLPGDFSETPITPLFRAGGDSDIAVSVDVAGMLDGNFEDIVKINMRRISPFPSWLMDWVTRQIEEIANKLTDFPTLFVILPDFSGIFDSDWGLKSGNADRFGADALSIDNELTGNATVDGYAKKVNSGIKEAYEFIGSTPLVYLDQETVNITVPWISEAEIDKALYSRESTLEQREQEVSTAGEAWSLGKACKYTDPDAQKACEQENELSRKAGVQFLSNANGLISSLRSNMDVIKSYKQIPENINKLVTGKQVYLEQILCNIDTLSYILGGRIGKNGIRFKAWVELYILIKSVLKSWQLLVDVFLDYEQECHDCKNERQDALEEEFSLIDLIMPKIPIIRFPKWPDIILDLHNIRAGLRVTLPEYNLNSKPIILPNLPNIYLPKVPSIDITAQLQLPSLPVLPTLQIPTLPDLPSLPRVELPDLPPPPKLPKLLSSIEVIVDIIKLITKAMCILKSSPLHPEWRAGDQIAFLTERTGYLGFDFFEATMPEFSFPFVDAIKVSTYVNLEFEADFIVEMARQIAMPINAFSNDFTNIFNINPNNLDMRDIVPAGTVPSNLDIDVGPSGVDGSVGKADIKYNLQKILAQKVSTDIQHLATVIDKNKDVTVDNAEFKQLINKALASKTITSDPKLDKVRELWQQTNNLTYSNEDRLIKELQDNNTEKFDAVKDIINTEIILNKELKKQLDSYGKKPIITKVGSTDTNKIDSYNQTLSKYNDKFIETAKKLIDGEGDGTKQELQQYSKDLMNSINTPLQKYSEGLANRNANYSNEVSTLNSDLLASVATNSSNISNLQSVQNPNSIAVSDKLLAAVDTFTNNDTSAQNSCQAQASSPYSYKYKGLYILEGNTSYRLFDYLDELDGNEETKSIDIDGDSDEDMFYFVNGELFLKENLTQKPTKSYVTTNPITIKSGDNKFFNGDKFFDQVNNAREVTSANGRINFGFSASTDNTVHNYRLGFYQLVDKSSNLDNPNYRPLAIKRDIVDAISAIDDTTIVSKNELFTKRNNLAYMKNVGNLKGVKLQTKELINIKTDLEANNVVNLTKGTKLYAGANSYSINYIDESVSDTTVKSTSIGANQNIQFYNDIKIVGISGSAYIAGSKDQFFEGASIRNLLGKPLFPGSKITYTGTSSDLSEQSYVDLQYYDGSELGLDFSETSSWELYNLGYQTSDYYIRLYRENDFYYAKINSFKNNLNGTLSSQILLSPQKESDRLAPELSIGTIRVPVYQKKTIDLTPYIYEDSGIKNVKKVIVDMDLTLDTDGDGNTRNDDDGLIDGEYKNKVNINYSLLSLKLDIGKFDNIFKKKIGFTLIDQNNNAGYKEVDLEVYSPKPSIIDYNNGKVDGKLNEDLTDEPVNLYRFRGGVVTSLQDETGFLKSKTDTGKYDFNVSGSGSGLKLYREGQQIASVDEHTGKITLSDSTLQTRVLSSTNSKNDSVFPKIILSDNAKDIFYQYVQMQEVTKVNVVDNFDDVKDRGIYYLPTNQANYGYYTIPETLDYNPGALSIYRLSDLAKNELFTIFNDGRINNLNEFYDIQYIANEKNWYFRLIDTRFNREIGKLMFILDSDYLMR
ncbi:MAG: VCBS repeat-containing protein [Candidatus Gracilibacteria bacterium]|nr:VCBS repeat-containing protein [Candidatus Gracilibacteria bacterium]